MNVELVEEVPKVTANDLPSEFRLTEFGKASSKSCVVEKELYEKWLPEPKQQSINWIVQEILEDVDIKQSPNGEEFLSNATEIENSQSKNALFVREFTMTALPQETGEQFDISNVIYPIVDDPFTMGQIACAALLSKLFIMRLYTCTRAVFMIAVCNKWTQSEQDIVEKLALDGFKLTASELNIVVNEAEMHVNSDCMIGGLLTVFRSSKQSTSPNNSIIGDVIVLTKPLGVQTALDAYKCFKEKQTDTRERLCRVISEEDLTKAYNGAISLMTTLNSHAMKLTDGHEVHALTEINGLSLMEHAHQLAEQQSNEVTFYIYNLPLIAKMLPVSKVLGTQLELIQGNIPEISGGVLLVMPREQAASYCRHLLNEGSRAWIIGVVEEGQRTANMIKKARIIDWCCKTDTVLK